MRFKNGAVHYMSCPVSPQHFWKNTKAERSERVRANATGQNPKQTRQKFLVCFVLFGGKYSCDGRSDEPEIVYDRKGLLYFSVQVYNDIICWD